MNKKIVPGENGPKEIKIEKLKKQIKRGFCETPHSRESLRENTDINNLYRPPFDHQNLIEDLARLMEEFPYNLSKTKAFQHLIKSIQKINDTYLFPAAIISLVLVDNKKGTGVYNAKTYAKLERSLKDWAIEDKKSIAHHLLFKEEKGTIFNFFSITPYGHPNTFSKFSEEYCKNMPETADRVSEMSEEEGRQWAEERTKLDTTLPPGKVKNYELLQKEMPKKIGTDEDEPILSAMLAPLWFQDELQGAIVIGTDIFDCYTTRDRETLPENYIFYFQMFMETIAGIIYQLRLTE